MSSFHDSRAPFCSCRNPHYRSSEAPCKITVPRAQDPRYRRQEHRPLRSRITGPSAVNPRHVSTHQSGSEPLRCPLGTVSLSSVSVKFDTASKQNTDPRTGALGMPTIQVGTRLATPSNHQHGLSQHPPPILDRCPGTRSTYRVTGCRTDPETVGKHAQSMQPDMTYHLGPPSSTTTLRVLLAFIT